MRTYSRGPAIGGTANQTTSNDATRSSSVRIKSWGRDERPGHSFGDASPIGKQPVQRQMEERLGHNFSNVRVHEGVEAPAIGGTAFTRGQHIHFAPGKYDPTSTTGRKLLRHELVHVVRQQQGRVQRLSQGEVPINADPKLEAEADAENRSATKAPNDGGSAPSPVQRQRTIGAEASYGFEPETKVTTESRGQAEGQSQAGGNCPAKAPLAGSLAPVQLTRSMGTRSIEVARLVNTRILRQIAGYANSAQRRKEVAKARGEAGVRKVMYQQDREASHRDLMAQIRGDAPEPAEEVVPPRASPAVRSGAGTGSTNRSGGGSNGDVGRTLSPRESTPSEAIPTVIAGVGNGRQTGLAVGSNAPLSGLAGDEEQVAARQGLSDPQSSDLGHVESDSGGSFNRRFLKKMEEAEPPYQRETIGSGAFGALRPKGRDKVEKHANWKGEAQLRNEHKIYQTVGEHENIAKYHSPTKNAENPDESPVEGRVENTPVTLDRYPMSVAALSERMPDAERRPLERAAVAGFIDSGVKSGLRHMHSKEIAHNDIKPDNVMLSAGGVPKIVDMGLASPIGAVGVSGTGVYLPPTRQKAIPTSGETRDNVARRLTVASLLGKYAPSHQGEGQTEAGWWAEHNARKKAALDPESPASPQEAGPPRQIGGPDARIRQLEELEAREAQMRSGGKGKGEEPPELTELTAKIKELKRNRK